LKWILLLTGLVGLVLLQVSAIPAFSLFGVAPNLLLVVLACWVVVRGQVEAMVLVPMAGIGIGLLTFQGMGESVAAFVPIVAVAALRTGLPARTEYVWALAVVIIATVLHFTTIAASIEVEGSSIDWVAAVTDVLVPSIVTNVVIALVVYWLIRLPTPKPIPRVI
jgi:rod shape-determining protein MreD